MQLSKALKKLFPDITFIGLDGNDCLLLDQGAGQYIAQWNRVEPQPTQAELDAAWLDYQADQADANTTFQAIKTQAQSAVGVDLAALTTAQVRSLLAILLWQAGGVDKDGLVNPLSEWVK